MSWRFTILNNRTSIATVINEPVGWDKNKNQIKRDLEWHGLFFNSQGDSNQGVIFEFYGTAERLLKAEYEAYGIEADMTLIMDEDCGHGFEEYDRGNFEFKDYEYNSGNPCFVKCSIVANNEVMLLRNRVDQKVNLETDKAFDEITALPAYTKLPFPMLLPSKGIFIQDEFQNETLFTTPVQGVPENNNPGTGPSDYNSEYGMIEIGFDKNKLSEIGNASSLQQSIYNCVVTSAGYLGCSSFDRFLLVGSIGAQVAPLEITPWVNFSKESPNYDAVDNPCLIDILCNGSIEVLVGSINAVWFVVAVLPENKTGNADADYIYLRKQLIYDVAGPGLTVGSVLSLNQSYTNSNFNLTKGDRIYCYYTVYHRRQNADQNGLPGWQMTFDAGNYFKLNNVSHTPATTSKVFAINEAISRVAETITENGIKAYSEYFGRTDSEPYSHAEDGCGSLEVITDGIRIRRQENKTPGQTSIFAVSLKELFEGLNPIHNIGMGIEADANRPGYNRLRVEPWHHFYNDEVIMYCRNINKIKRTLYEKEIYSSFQFGYQKWEAEQYNGLDEFLTKRNYRTTLKQINNKLAKLSAFVFSGYAMEITRRIGNNNSKDWRYDKDVFGICITREIRVHTIFNSIDNTIKIFLNGNTYPTIPGTFDITGTLFNNTTYTRSFTNDMVEVDGDTFILTFGVVEIVVDEENYTTQIINFLFFPRLSVELGNVINAVNIIEPGTLYNYRRSPVRNAMRWLNKILASYRVFGINAKIIFTDGDGNYFAEGEMESVRCKLENAAIKENATLSRTNFIDANEARPSLRPERVVYEYPMNSCEYKAIKANPNGLIYFEDECEHGFGYIDTLVHRPKEAMANFTLIPAVKSVELLTGCNVPTGLQVVNILPSVVIPGYWNVQIEFDTVTPTPAGGYDWELDENPVTGVIQSGNTSNAGAIQSFTIADVANGGSWQVRIRSNCGSGAYSAWAIINFTTP